jgi:hypothetical protein
VLFASTVFAAGVEKISKPIGGGVSDGDSYEAHTSASGRFVCFTSYATNLVPNDTNNRRDVFLWDTTTRTLTRVSTDSAGVEGNGSSFGCRLSSDGRFIAFLTASTNIVSGTSGFADVVLYDRRTGVRRLVSTTVSGAGANGGDAGIAGVSRDGKYVAWYAEAYAPMDPTAPTGAGLLARQVYVKNLRTGVIKLLSRAPNGDLGNNDTMEAWFSDDAKYLLFRSRAANLVVPSVPNGGYYLYDFGESRIKLVAKTDVDDVEPTPNFRRLLVSRPSRTTKNHILGNSPQIVLRPGASQLEGSSISGRYIAFISQDGRLVPGGAPNFSQVVLRDTEKNRSILISKGTNGGFSNNEAITGSISASGRTLAFSSLASNLTADADQPGTQDIFVATISVPADK